MRVNVGQAKTDLSKLLVHHLDPASKSFTVAFGGLTRSIDRARTEAAKCVLLCASCHMEVEAGVTSLARLEVA